MTRSANTVEEEEIISLIWKRIRRPHGKDPFDDDVAWVLNRPTKCIVEKADMLVAATDCPKQMTPSQIARKSITSCVSDFAAKGVMPTYCIVSIGLPKKLATRQYVTGLGDGFSKAQKRYGVEIIAGDMNATANDVVIDCSLFGFSDSVVRRNGAKPGDLVGVTGPFGHQNAGLSLLLDKATSKDFEFRKRALYSVLEPVARLETGTEIAPYLSSSIDSSDGLALSLYHLAESSRVSIEVDNLPVSKGLESFAKANSKNVSDLVLFGGEEYEIVCTFDPKHRSLLKRYGITIIGVVAQGRPSVLFDGNEIPRRGWLHFPVS